MTLWDYFERAVERAPHAEAMVSNGRRWTYQQLREEVCHVTANLVRRDIHSGDHVLVVLKNRWENIIVYWACQYLGVIYTPINFRLSEAELAYCLEDSQAVLVVAEETLRPVWEQIMRSWPHPVQMVLVGGRGADSFEELRTPGLPTDTTPEPAHEDETAIMLYTAGTTGQPKGVPRSHRNEIAAAIAHIIQNTYTTGERTVAVMPFYHTMGMRSLLSMTFLNGSLILVPDYETDRLAELIDQESVSVLYLVPTLFYDLVNLPGGDRFHWQSLKKIGYAGAAMTTTLTQQCFARFHPTMFVNHFGSSEVYTYTICSWLDRKPACAGRPGFHEAIRLVPIGGVEVHPHQPVARGDVGEVIVHLSSPEAFQGYWHRPEANARALREGWYFTGDVGWQDEEGDLWVMGRVDDMLITGGENVHPLEVEDVLSQHPQVAEVAVVGLPDPRWGQVVTAFIVARHPDLTAEVLDQYCRASPILAQFKRPRRYIFVPEIPKSPVGKILRRRLKEGHYPA